MSLILVVDDEPMLRCALRRVLEDAGHTVLESTNGAEAFTVIRERAPDVILTDLYMPGGIRLLRAIRNAGVTGRVIALSGKSQGPEPQLAHEFGAQIVVTKPFIREELLAAIAKVQSDTQEPP